MEITAIILSSITFIWTIISFFLLHTQNMKLLVLQNEMDKSKYVSNIQFDLEFSIYKELSEKMLGLYNDVWWLYPSGIDERSAYYYDKPDKLKEYKLEIYNKSVKTYNTFSNTLNSYAPFIDIAIYNEFKTYEKMIVNQISIYEIAEIYSHKDYLDKIEKKKGINVWEKTKEIEEKKDEIVNKMRDYFKRLKELKK